MTQTTPFHGKFCTHGVNPAILNPFTKFEERSFIHSKNVEGVLKFIKGSRYQNHALFIGNFSPHAAGLSVDDPLAIAKFKECSFTRSRNIEGGLKFC